MSGSDAVALGPSAESKLNQIEEMSPDEFKKYGYQVIDWIADYLAHPERYSVLSQATRGDTKGAVPATAPVHGEDMDRILADVDKIVVPGMTHWNHPAFFAYFAISGSAPGILAEALSAAFNVNAMMWRTSPAATELEEVTLDWLRQLLGLSTGFSGVIYDTASISSLCAIAAAREAVPGFPVREQGLGWTETTDGHSGPIRLRLYASEEAHSSIDKAAITLGLGQAGLRKIPTDNEFRMRPEALAAAIEEDRAAGWRPFCVVATVGTTSTTSVDPVPEIAKICRRERLWLHVDGAYGGTCAIVPEMKWVLEGCEHADSLVVNPHKWLFTPVDLSALYCRRMDVLRRAFSLIPEYLRSAEVDLTPNFMDYGPQLGRRFRALKLWFVMRYYGAEGLVARIREHIRLAREFASWIDLNPDFERMAPAPFSTVCFRVSHLKHGGDTTEQDDQAVNDLNERLLGQVNREGKVFLSHTKLRNKFTLRLAIGNIRTREEHIELAKHSLQAALNRIRGE
ncbi:MAG TPA: pyridoxal-dependent decarboxylase [Blastocatellia bacterium]